MPTHTAYQTVALHRRAKDGDRGDNAVTYAIVLAQTVLTEGTTGTMVYLDKTVGDNSPQRLVRTQMEAEGITIEGTNVEKYGTGYHRIYVQTGLVYGTNYTVIAYKTDGDNKTEIARATLGVTKKGDSTYLAQVTPASIELQTDADGYPIIESDMVITHDAALDDKDITKFMPCPNKTLFGYDVFMSCNKGKHLTASRMRIHFKGVSEIVFMYSSFAESKYDYIMLSNINTSLPTTCISTNAAVKYHTNDKQTPGIVNEARYGNLNPDTEYFIDVMFRKDTSGDEDDDRGYIAIPVPTNSYTLTPSMQNATGNVTFDFDDSQLSLPADSGLDYHKARPFIVRTATNVPVKQCELMLPVKDSGEGGTQLVRVPINTVAQGKNGDTGNSLNWILWSEARKTQRTFHSKQSVGDTNIADIVIDDLSKDPQGIHTNLKYVCIRDFDHAPSTDDTPFDYSDKKEPRPDVVYFAQLDYLGNVATDLLVSDAVSTKILNAVNANIHNLDAYKLTVRNVQAQSSDGNTTVIIDGKEGKLTAKNADISGKLTATEGEIGGFTIGKNSISNTNGKISLNSSGVATIGGLSVDASGNTSIDGKVQASKGFRYNCRTTANKVITVLDTDNLIVSSFKDGNNNPVFVLPAPTAALNGMLLILRSHTQWLHVACQQANSIYDRDGVQTASDYYNVHYACGYTVENTSAMLMCNGTAWFEIAT